NRIAALTRVGRLQEAQTLAYNLAEGAPESESRQQMLAQMLVKDRPALGAEILHSDTNPLTYAQYAVSGGFKLTSRLSVAVEVADRDQRTTDTDVIARVPSHDRQIQFTVRDTTPER